MAATILDARIGQVQGGKLRVRVGVADAALQTAHSLLGRHSLGADCIGDLEVEGDVLQRGRCGALDLSIELAHTIVAEPRRHRGGYVCL